MALMQFVLLPEDDYSLACALEARLCQQRCQRINFSSWPTAASHILWARLSASDDASCREARKILEEWLKASENLRPFEFLSMVLIKTRKAFLARLGSEAGDALDALLEVPLSL